MLAVLQSAPPLTGNSKRLSRACIAASSSISYYRLFATIPYPHIALKASVPSTSFSCLRAVSLLSVPLAIHDNHRPDIYPSLTHACVVFIYLSLIHEHALIILIYIFTKRTTSSQTAWAGNTVPQNWGVAALQTIYIEYDRKSLNSITFLAMLSNFRSSAEIVCLYSIA